MTQSGFFEPRKLSPTGLAMVVAMHAAALGALALMKGPEIVKAVAQRTKVELIPLPEDPPPVPPQPVQQPVQTPRSVLDSLPTPLPQPTNNPVVSEPPMPPGPVFAEIGERTLPPIRTGPPVLPPVRVEAELDPRYAGDLQPPYPSTEERAGREGTVRVRVTVGADGRVKAVQRLSATNEVFWRVTERQALTRWRFRPATLDGRPVEGSKVMNVFFRLEG